MRKGFLTALVWLLTTAPLVLAEPPVEKKPEAMVVEPEEAFWSDPPPESPQRFRLNADYLLWWARRGPVGTPLVTTGSTNDAVPGALGQSSTAVLFGDGGLNFGTFSGLRLEADFDLGDGWQIQGGGFGLEHRGVGSTFASDVNGNPLLARPFFDNQAGALGAYLDSQPGALTGNVVVRARTRLQGYELTVGTDLLRLRPWLKDTESSFSIGVLAGFRTLELNEDLEITDNVTALVPGQLTFLAGPADPPNSLTIQDHFHNYNHFYGGQIGGWARWHTENVDFGITGKLALGVTQQLAVIDGTTNLITPGSNPTPNAGGVLVQPTNSGRFFESNFGIVPEVGLDLGYWVTLRVRLGLGYQFLYWSRVSRPGNDIDTVVNAAQVPRDPRFGNGLGDPRPAFQFQQSDFWAMGFNFSVLFQY